MPACVEPLNPDDLDSIISSVEARIAVEKAREAAGKGDPWYPPRNKDGSYGDPMSATVVDENGNSRDALIKFNDDTGDFLITTAHTGDREEDLLEQEVADFNKGGRDIPEVERGHEHYWKNSDGTYSGTSRGEFDWPGDEDS